MVKALIGAAILLGFAAAGTSAVRADTWMLTFTDKTMGWQDESAAEPGAEAAVAMSAMQGLARYGLDDFSSDDGSAPSSANGGGWYSDVADARTISDEGFDTTYLSSDFTLPPVPEEEEPI